MNKLKILIILIGLIPSIIFSQLHGNQYDQLILRGATLINSTGAPPIGPVDIVIENNIIKNEIAKRGCFFDNPDKSDIFSRYSPSFFNK